jgi:hypothetical protein
MATTVIVATSPLPAVALGMTGTTGEISCTVVEMFSMPSAMSLAFRVANSISVFGADSPASWLGSVMFATSVLARREPATRAAAGGSGFSGGSADGGGVEDIADGDDAEEDA